MKYLCMHIVHVVCECFFFLGREFILYIESSNGFCNSLEAKNLLRYEETELRIGDFE